MEWATHTTLSTTMKLYVEVHRADEVLGQWAVFGVAGHMVVASARGGGVHEPISADVTPRSFPSCVVGQRRRAMHSNPPKVSSASEAGSGTMSYAVNCASAPWP